MEKNKRKEHIRGANSQAEGLDKNVRFTYGMVGIGIIFLLIFIISNVLLNRISNEQVENTTYLNQYRIGSKVLTASVQGYATTGDIAYYNDYMKELNEDKNRDIAWEALKENNLKESEWSALEHIAQMSQNLVPIEEKAMDSVKQGRLSEAQSYVFGDSYEKVVKEINSSTDTCIKNIQSRMSATKNIYNIAMYISMILFIVSFIAIVLRIRTTVAFSKKELLTPIVKVSDQLKELAGGHFVNNMDLVEDDSEVGNMVGAINFMNRNFTNMITELSAVLEKMGQGNYNVELTQEYVGEFEKIKDSMIKIITDTKETLKGIQNAAHEIGSGSEQLAQAATDLAEGSTVQASKISETTAMIDSMAESIESKAKEAEETAQISKEAAKVVHNGNIKMQELKEAISRISDCSKEIHSIIEVIEDIAGQTNLLSLNASIEAARAGEHGRGFAVVASEVRNLASQSAKSSKEITDTINQVQHSVKETVSSMHEVYDNASAQKGKADSVGNLLKQVVDAAYAANEVARNIENEIAYQREITDEAKNALKA